tara:strand:+ start:429 stop:674 length:246 start_codon:yes stop_codon:yes gene_type:complete
LVVSLNLAAITEPEAAHKPIPATFEIPFQRRQNGCAKPIVIAAAILEGRQPPHLTAKTLRSLPELPMDWSEQQRILGFAQS